MGTIQHESLTYAEQHVIHRWEYADAAVRTAATGFTSADVKKLAYQADDDTYWVLTNHSPITWVQVSSGDVYTKSEVDALIAAVNSVLTGTIVPTGRSSAPSGYLMCDGSAVSRTTYADLFSAIGTAYGSGDGSTTFNLPDLQGKFPRGKDSGASLGDTGGSETVDLSHQHTTGDHTLTVSEIPAHNHQATYLNVPVGTGGANYNYLRNYSSDSGQGVGDTGGGGSHNHGATGSEGSSAQNVMNPYVVVNYMIKT